MSGALVLIAGGWVLAQLFGGDALGRLGIVGSAEPSTVNITQDNLKTPGEDARDRREQLQRATNPAPSYGAP